MPWNKNWKLYDSPFKMRKPKKLTKYYNKKTKKVVSNKRVRKIERALVKMKPEVKQVRMLYEKTGAFGIPDYNSVNFGQDNNIFLLSPTQNRIQITQGTGQANRVGNRIRTVSSYISGILYATQQNATYNPTPKPMEVMMFVYKLIGGGNTSSSTLTNLFQNGNGTSSPTGGLADLTFPFNKDEYKILWRKTYKIGSAINTGTGASAGLQNYANNDYKRNQKFVIPLTKFLDKNIKYNDNAPSANNDQVYLAILPLAADGTVNAPGNGLAPISCIMTQVYKFTDV